MRIRRLDRFVKSFKKLDAGSRKKIETAIRKLVADPWYPSLQTSKLEGTGYIFYCRASDELRITFHFDGETIVLRNCGHHDPTLRKP